MSPESVCVCPSISLSWPHKDTYRLEFYMPEYIYRSISKVKVIGHRSKVKVTMLNNVSRHALKEAMSTEDVKTRVLCSSSLINDQ